MLSSLRTPRGMPSQVLDAVGCGGGESFVKGGATDLTGLASSGGELVGGE